MESYTRWLPRFWLLCLILSAISWQSAVTEQHETPNLLLDNWQTTLGTLETEFKMCKTGLQESQAALTECKQQFEEMQTELGKLRSEITASSKALTEAQTALTASNTLVKSLQGDLQSVEQQRAVERWVIPAAIVGAFVLGMVLNKVLP